jgi:hypothetical protein
MAAEKRETARQRRARFAGEYQRQRETWGIGESARRAAAALGVEEGELRETVGLDGAGRYKGRAR